MKYIIDSGNHNEINEALALGACGVTANTSMYKKNNTSLPTFVETYANQGLDFLSGEVIGTYEEMLDQAKRLVKIDSHIVIKINFSKDGLRLVKRLKREGITTAMTLLFTLAQATAAINAGADYLFFFIGRNEEMGNDGLAICTSIQAMIDGKGYPTKLVAASIKNLYQLECLMKHHIDYAAIPYALYMKSLEHPLTVSGAAVFEEDYYSNTGNTI